MKIYLQVQLCYDSSLMVNGLNFKTNIRTSTRSWFAKNNNISFGVKELERTPGAVEPYA